MKNSIISAVILLATLNAFSQVGIGTASPAASAALEVASTTKGFLPPRMTYAQKTAISTPATGLTIWCSNCGSSGELQVYNGTTWTNITGSAALASVPDAPTIGVATFGNAQVSVAFTAPTSNGGSAITSYTVTASGGITATGATSPLIVTGLTNGTSYTFTVHATNAVGNSVASVVSAAVTPATVPGAPTSAVATPGNTQASVAFTAPTSNGGSTITSYTVTALGGINATGTTSPIIITGLTSGANYVFNVRATNIIGNSSPSSATTTVTTIAPSGAAVCNGTRVTDIVEFTSTYTGKVWMDRNLGASRVGGSETDYFAYGCLYQWGRGNDGHASITWTSANAGAAVNGNTATTQVATDTPGNTTFITNASDWRSPQNNSLWQGVNGINNPCPAGFRLPTAQEWHNELDFGAYNTSTTIAGFSSPFKFVLAGDRLPMNGGLANIGTMVSTWSSTTLTPYASRFFISTTQSLTYSVTGSSRACGYPVRCIKN